MAEALLALQSWALAAARASPFCFLPCTTTRCAGGDNNNVVKARWREPGGGRQASTSPLLALSLSLWRRFVFFCITTSRLRGNAVSARSWCSVVSKARSCWTRSRLLAAKKGFRTLSSSRQSYWAALVACSTSSSRSLLSLGAFALSLSTRPTRFFSTQASALPCHAWFGSEGLAFR